MTNLVLVFKSGIILRNHCFLIGSWICDNCVAERNGKRKRPQSNVPATLLQHDDYITFKTPTGKKGSQKRKGPATENDEETITHM